MDRNAFACLLFFMSQRGDSGQNQIPQARMKDGMNAEPSCRRHAISPASLTMTLAQKPKKIPAGDISTCIRKSKNEQLTSHDPKLPKHDKSTTNSSWCHFCGVDGDSGIFGTNPYAHDKASSEKTLP
jgi:hypothetical protein